MQHCIAILISTDMKHIKLLFLLSLLIVIRFNISAQDMIYKTDETVISAKVLEINNSSVKYKLFNSSLEKVFEISKLDIHYIIYQNGTKEFYNTNPKPAVVEQSNTNPIEKPKIREVHRNIIAVNCFDMFFTNFSLSYERVLNSGKFSIKIPVSIGLQGKPNTQNYTSDVLHTEFLQNRNYAVGLDLNVYPFGQTHNTFYFGISTFAGSFNYYKDSTLNSNYNSYNYSPTVVDHIKYIGTHYSAMLHIGGYLGLGDNFMIGAKLGVGFKREETIEEDYTMPVAQFDFNLAYRF